MKEEDASDQKVVQLCHVSRWVCILGTPVLTHPFPCCWFSRAKYMLREQRRRRRKEDSTRQLLRTWIRNEEAELLKNYTTSWWWWWWRLPYVYLEADITNTMHSDLLSLTIRAGGEGNGNESECINRTIPELQHPVSVTCWATLFRTQEAPASGNMRRICFESSPHEFPSSSFQVN